MMSVTPTSPLTPELAQDILEGADAIAEYLCGSKLHRRKVYYWAETGRLPIFRMGTMLCARKSQLAAFIADQEKRSLQRNKKG